MAIFPDTWKKELTYVFDVGARVDGDDIAVLDAEVVTNDTVNTGTAVIEIIVRQHNQNGVFSLLALHQDCVTSEKLKGIHGVVGEGNDGVVVVDGIGDTTRIAESVRGNRTQGPLPSRGPPTSTSWASSSS